MQHREDPPCSGAVGPRSLCEPQWWFGLTLFPLLGMHLKLLWPSKVIVPWVRTRHEDVRGAKAGNTAYKFPPPHSLAVSPRTSPLFWGTAIAPQAWEHWGELCKKPKGLAPSRANKPQRPAANPSPKTPSEMLSLLTTQRKCNPRAGFLPRAGGEGMPGRKLA